ncbi:MAG: hypothetical protein CL489_08705 [Acidobacteria bacterium]|nr:hypothetical protein [Acidobacteriota bacterium]
MNIVELKKHVKNQHNDWSIMWQEERSAAILSEAKKLYLNGRLKERTFKAAKNWAKKEIDRKIYMGGELYV